MVGKIGKLGKIGSDKTKNPRLLMVEPGIFVWAISAAATHGWLVARDTLLFAWPSRSRGHR